MTKRHGPVPRGRKVKRIAGAASCLGAAAAVAAHSASATFYGTSTVSQSATNAGDLYLTIPSAGSTNRMTLAVSDLYPSSNNDSYRYRAVDVTNAGNLDLSAFTITTQSDVSNKLSNNGANGLVMAIKECPVSWTEDWSNSPDNTYTCGPGAAWVLGDTTFATLNVYQVTPNATSPYTYSTPTLANIDLTAGHVNHLLFCFKLYATADSAAQGQSENVTFTFGGTARSGTNL